MKPAKAGYYNGTFNISFPAAETDSSDSEAGESTEDDTDTSATDMLAGFGAVIKLTSDADADTSTLDLTVTTSGAALATLSITGSYDVGCKMQQKRIEVPMVKVLKFRILHLLIKLTMQQMMKL